ncbi:MAG: sugar phosphate isomerase/epimerase, partial [Armatimonadetes bacterium]|nr:sugar phosphate isomerase/epimerase [Armatimonadota bacterium]
ITVNDPRAGFLISSIAWQGVPHREAISEVREAGFGGVEILCKPGHFESDNPAHVRDVQLALDEWSDAVVTFHAPFHNTDLSSSDPDSWDCAVQEMMQALEVASLLRAENVTLHVRSKAEVTRWSADNLVALQRALNRLMHGAAERNMTLAVENLHPLGFTGKKEDFLRLFEAFPAHLVGACIDTGHAHLGGNLVELAQVLAARAFVAHLHDNSALGRDEHLIPGEGTIPWTELIDVLRTRGFSGRLVLEVLSVGTLGETLENLKKAIVETGLYKLVE